MVGFIKKVRFSTTGFSRRVRVVQNFTDKRQIDERLATQNPTRRITGVNR